MISILALLLQTVAAPAPAPVPPAAPTAAPTPAPAPVAPWTVTNRTNTDGTIHSTLAGTPSNDGGARLVMRCDAGAEKVVSVQLFAKTGGAPDRPVTLTIDYATPMGTNWEFIDRGAYIREDIAVTTITTAIASSKKIKLRTTTATGEPIEAIFAGPPSAEPVKAVLMACGYTLGTPPVRVDPNAKKKK